MHIHKELENTTTTPMGLDGFAFKVYQLDEKGNKIHEHTIGKTNEDGYLLHHELLNQVAPGDSFTYYVEEIAGSVAGMEYVKEPVEIKVELIDALDGTLDTVINGQVTNQYNVTFANRYNGEQEPQNPPVDQPVQTPTDIPEPPIDDDSLPPKTGDPSPLGAVGSMMLFSTLGFVACVAIKKRKMK
jgi:hypothetical protein